MRDKERNLRGAPAHRLAHIHSFDHYGNSRALGTGREPHLAHLVPGDNSPRLARLCWLRTDQGPNRRQSDMIAQALIV